MRFLNRIFATLLLASFSCLAQSAPPIDRLPKDTSFFFAWNGIRNIEQARATNSLLRLWDDPEFVRAREVLAERAARDSKSPNDRRSKEQLDSFLDLAANPFILGLSGPFDLKAMTAKPAPGTKAKPSGFFLIYDLTGKAEPHQKLLAEWAAKTSEKPVVTSTTFAGVTVTKEETSKSASWNAIVGSYYVTSDSQPVLESLIPRLKGPAPAESVLSSLAYQAAAAQRLPDAFFEVFFRMPDLTKMEMPPSSGVDVAAVLKALHLDRLQAFAATASLAGNGTQMRMAVLGDTSPGSLFDLFGASAGEFKTLAIAPAGSSYSATRFDFLALYQTLRNALRAGLPPEQYAQVETMETMLAAQLGMGIGEILQAVSGEIASISLESANDGSGDATPATDPLRDLYAVSIDRPEEVLKLVRMFMASSITAESREGDATTLAVTSPYRDEKTGAQRKRFNYVGITPRFLIVAPRKVLLREAIVRSNAQQGPAAGGLAADAGFTQARNRLPVHLTALSYADLSRWPVQAVLDAAVKRAAADEKDKLTPQEEEVLRSLPKIVARYLRTAFGGSWKNRNGLFFDTYIE